MTDPRDDEIRRRQRTRAIIMAVLLGAFVRAGLRDHHRQDGDAAMTDLARRNGRTAALAGLLVLAMVGLAFASVPLYRLFCQVTGFDGTTSAPRRRPARWPARRWRSASTPTPLSSLPWRFGPEKTREIVTIGEREMAFYTAKNLSARAVTGTATFNVTPGPGRQIFQQDPVLLLHRADPEAGRGSADAGGLLRRSARSSRTPTRAPISEITLSYTFYPVDSGGEGS